MGIGVGIYIHGLWLVFYKMYPTSIIQVLVSYKYHHVFFGWMVFDLYSIKCVGISMYI